MSMQSTSSEHYQKEAAEFEESARELRVAFRALGGIDLDLRDVTPAIAAAVPEGTVVVLGIIEPRPSIEDGFCQGCGFPVERLVPCPRGAACRWVFCDCAPCRCGTELDDLLGGEE